MISPSSSFCFTATTLLRVLLDFPGLRSRSFSSMPARASFPVLLRHVFPGRWAGSLSCAVEQWQLASLISWRSLVRLGPAQP